MEETMRMECAHPLSFQWIIMSVEKSPTRRRRSRVSLPKNMSVCTKLGWRNANRSSHHLRSAMRSASAKSLFFVRDWKNGSQDDADVVRISNTSVSAVFFLARYAAPSACVLVRSCTGAAGTICLDFVPAWTNSKDPFQS